MLIEKAREILTGQETRTQVRKALKKAFCKAKFRVKLLRKDNGESYIAVLNNPEVPQHKVEKILGDFVGFVDIGSGINIPLWHEFSSGSLQHFDVASMGYYEETGRFKEIAVSLQDKRTNVYEWKYWRLSSEEFDKCLRPYLNRWDQKNVEMLYAIIVNNELQTEVADRAHIKRQSVHSLIKRGHRIYMKVKLASFSPELIPHTETRPHNGNGQDREGNS